MSISFVSQNIWPQITKAVRSAKRPCDVAVAYFGTGAPQLLPLPRGSRLVVDASDRAVSSGQTNPSDLLAMMKRGVQVFTVPNLHAKVYVLGRNALIGSANVSNHSATQLLEALLHTTDAKIIASTRKYIRSLCLHELTPTLITRLKKLYRPPHMPGGKRRKSKTSSNADQPALPRLLLAQLELQNWSTRDQMLHDTGLKIAKKRREHPQSYELESFRYIGKCPFQKGDVVNQITNEGDNQVLVTPPGNVRYVRSRKDPNKQVSFVYLERPANKRRKSVKQLTKRLGRKFGVLLCRNGLVRNRVEVQTLLNTQP